MNLLSDLRCAFRRLAKAPGFTAVVLLTLALGIGVNTSMYTLVDVLFFRSVPFPEPDRLVSVLGTTPQNQRDQFSFAEGEEMRTQTVGAGKAFESLTTYSFWNNTLVPANRPAERPGSRRPIHRDEPAGRPSETGCPAPPVARRHRL